MKRADGLVVSSIISNVRVILALGYYEERGGTCAAGLVRAACNRALRIEQLALESYRYVPADVDFAGSGSENTNASPDCRKRPPRKNSDTFYL